MSMRRLAPTVLVALAAACNTPSNGGSDAGTQAVSGTVLEASNGAPIANAQLCILDHPEVKCALTDGSGAYSLDLPVLATALDVAVNATAAGHLGFTGLVEEPPATDGGVIWFATIWLTSDASATDLFADAGLVYPDPGKAFVLLSVFSSNGAAVVGETATLSPDTGAGPIYLDASGSPEPSLTSLTSDGYLLFGGLTPGKIEITLAGNPCTPISLSVDAWPDATPQTVAGETAPDSMTLMDVVCQ